MNNIKTTWVSKFTDCTKLAQSIHISLCEDYVVELFAIGKDAVNTAYKALAIVQSLSSQSGFCKLDFFPEFRIIEDKAGEKRTVVVWSIKKPE
jgi:stage V sporulation protein SpoVS